MAISPNQIHTPEEATQYMTECTLATVDDFCMAKNPKKGEFRRQISIAQHGVDWVKSFSGFNIKGRVATVINVHAGSVKDYAIEVRKRHQPKNPVSLEKP